MAKTAFGFMVEAGTTKEGNGIIHITQEVAGDFTTLVVSCEEVDILIAYLQQAKLQIVSNNLETGVPTVNGP